MFAIVGSGSGFGSDFPVVVAAVIFGAVLTVKSLGDGVDEHNDDGGNEAGEDNPDAPIDRVPLVRERGSVLVDCAKELRQHLPARVLERSCSHLVVEATKIRSHRELSGAPPAFVSSPSSARLSSDSSAVAWSMSRSSTPCVSSGVGAASWSDMSDVSAGAVLPARSYGAARAAPRPGRYAEVGSVRSASVAVPRTRRAGSIAAMRPATASSRSLAAASASSRPAAVSSVRPYAP